jgi:hypothetical protein
MSIRLVTYSDQNMTISRKKCIESFAYYYIMQDLSIHEWDREMIEQTEFYQMNREILDTPRGSGLWAWKSYIIYKAMLDMEDGDILIYSDAGIEFINSVQHIIDVMDQDVFLFGNNWNHVDWCKKDAIDSMLGGAWVDENEKQVQASVIFIRISERSKRIIKTWLCWCMMPNLIDDSKSAEPDYDEFREHRHDQALLTNVAIMYGLRKHWWPASYNDGQFVYDKIEQYKEDKYPVIFNHHRKRNHEYN